MVTAMRTAGRSVLTAGTTVVIGMLGLLVLRQSLLNGVAVAAAATVAMTVLASLTLLPALLGFTGTRLASRQHRPRGKVFGKSRQGQAARSGRWAHAGRSVRQKQMHRGGAVGGRRAAAPGLAAAGVRGRDPVLAAPALAMKLCMPDESAQARGTMGVRQLRDDGARGSAPGSTHR